MALTLQQVAAVKQLRLQQRVWTPFSVGLILKEADGDVVHTLSCRWNIRLVGGIPTSLKNMKVNLDDYS